MVSTKSGASTSPDKDSEDNRKNWNTIIKTKVKSYTTRNDDSDVLLICNNSWIWWSVFVFVLDWRIYVQIKEYACESNE